MYVCIYIYIYRERERERESNHNHGEKNYIFRWKIFLTHVFVNSFYLHLSWNRYIKYFLQFLQLVSNKTLKSCGKNILSLNDGKMIQGKLSDNNISTKSSKTKPDTIVMYVCGNCKNPKRVKKTKQKWII